MNFGEKFDIVFQPLKGTVKAYLNSSKYGGMTHVVPIFNTKSVNVTFHRNTSSSDTETTSQKVTYGVANQKFNANTFKRDGYKFVGWAFNENATKIDYPDLCNVVDSWIDLHYPKVDLYAVWSANQYTITYEPNGGVGEKYTQTATYDAYFKTMKNRFTRTGYTFTGFTDLNGRVGTYAKINKKSFLENNALKHPWQSYRQYSCNIYECT